MMELQQGTGDQSGTGIEPETIQLGMTALTN